MAYWEKVKLKTGAKGRPKEVVLKEGKEEKLQQEKKALIFIEYVTHINQ